MYTVHLSAQAKKALAKLDCHIAKMLVAWMRKNLENCHDPFAKGKPLTGDHKGAWRYRVGDYRIIAEAQGQSLVILVLATGHRKDVYDN
jgi:mRNA interferase RelE/StbE